MKKILSLLSVLTITGANLPTVFVTSNYEKVKKTFNKKVPDPIQLSTSLHVFRKETKPILIRGIYVNEKEKIIIEEKYNNFQNYFLTLLKNYFFTEEDWKFYTDKTKTRYFKFDYFLNNVNADSNIHNFNYSQKDIVFNSNKREIIEKKVIEKNKTLFVAGDTDEVALTPEFSFLEQTTASITTGFKLGYTFKLNFTVHSHEYSVTFEKSTTDTFSSAKTIKFPSQKTNVMKNSKKEVDYIIYNIKENMIGDFYLKLDPKQTIWIFSNKIINNPIKTNLLDLIFKMKDVINEAKETSNWKYSFDVIDEKTIILKIPHILEINKQEAEVKFGNNIPLK